MRILNIFCIFYKVILLWTFSCNFQNTCQQRKSAFTIILRLLIFHIHFFYNFAAHISTFCAKNSTFSNILQKLTLFCQDLAFSVWFLQKFQKSAKLEPPNVLVHEPKMCHILGLFCTKIDNTILSGPGNTKNRMNLASRMQKELPALLCTRILQNV